MQVVDFVSTRLGIPYIFAKIFSYMILSFGLFCSYDLMFDKFFYLFKVLYLLFDTLLAIFK